MRLTRFTLAAITVSGLVLTGCSPNEEIAEPSMTATPKASSETQPETHEEKPTDSTDEPAEEEAEDTNNGGLVPAGTTCGEAHSLADGSPLAVVTLEDGFSCDEVMTIFSDYMSDSPTGTSPQGSGAFWEAPNGWICGGNNFLFPGDEEYKLNKYPSCGPMHSQSGVVAVPPERIGELPV
ncbi:hypothetical protein [Corynebacterium tuscaniense]|uniref:hypothetical protein n=1 Tax=Corynebacterium tuscaniense TaxID=302449 RepID=UPI00123B76EB|nr:hypothetical protein [Corynebacterium tuscaniense]KAA8739330.1 hypothetical protein F4V54_05395 [Corynebacterium tuscaniense]